MPWGRIHPPGTLRVNGLTVHSAFQIPVNRKPYEPLQGASSTKLINRFRDVKFLILDEHSMVSARLLSFMEKRMHEIHPNCSEQLFAGIFVYFFGDVRQLVPVAELPMYMNPTNVNSPEPLYGINIFRNFDKYFELRICQRQKGDNLFIEFLNRLGDGNITDEDYELISQRREAALSPSERASFNDAVHLFRKNDDVDEYNESILRKNNQPVARIIAQGKNDFTATNKKDRSSGLTGELLISVNSKVMLRRNICTNAGLVNGAIGTVKYIVYQNDIKPPQFPYILVEFDNYQGPAFYDNCVPILPVESHWILNGIDCVRLQFPITLAYAITIYKSQGLTLKKAVIDISSNEGSAGSTYVAISRLKSMRNLMLKLPYPKDRWDITSMLTHQRKLDALNFIRAKIIENN